MKCELCPKNFVTLRRQKYIWFFVRSLDFQANDSFVHFIEIFVSWPLTVYIHVFSIGTSRITSSYGDLYLPSYYIIANTVFSQVNLKMKNNYSRDECPVVCNIRNDSVSTHWRPDAGPGRNSDNVILYVNTPNYT